MGYNDDPGDVDDGSTEGSETTHAMSKKHDLEWEFERLAETQAQLERRNRVFRTLFSAAAIFFVLAQGVYFATAFKGGLFPRSADSFQFLATQLLPVITGLFGSLVGYYFGVLGTRKSSRAKSSKQH
jgi:hypothetical protein